ncbi:MAG: DEAD/DEAH box helicase [Candidatus Zixiibacteriota bacterium]
MELWLILIAIILGYFIWHGVSNRFPSRGTEHTLKTKVALAKRGIGQRRLSRKFAAIERPVDFDLTDEKKEIIDLLENSDSNILLMGKAGTGKSNFLKYFRATTEKNIVVLAFTGVAAVNVQGQTIHSFFKFHPKTTLENIRRRREDYARIYKEVDILVIDEISMVRADLLDFVDKFMRMNGRDASQPFGGAQVLAIGDLFQLPPIVMEGEKEYFSKVYKSPFFFDSNVFRKSGFIKMELTKVYRQDNLLQVDFIKALDKLRDGSFSQKEINLINSRCEPLYEKPTNEHVISLVPTNQMAAEINNYELSKLHIKPIIYGGNINGEFKENNLPTDLNLKLKVGAQVMLLNNDSRQRWVNGDLAKVIKTNADSVRVIFEDGTFDDIIKYKWDSIKYTYDEQSKKIQPEVAGTFTQLPLKLAWAITIHKGQGKTFDKVHIDFGRGTFAAGQAYVALSRCRALEGMVLTSPLESAHIFTDQVIIEFMKNNIDC